MPASVEPEDHQRPNEWYLIFEQPDAGDVQQFVEALTAYIGEQESECKITGKVIKNEVSSSYSSTSGGNGIISGRFDPRIHAWIVEQIAAINKQAVKDKKSTHKIHLEAVVAQPIAQSKPDTTSKHEVRLPDLLLYKTFLTVLL